VLRIAVHVLGGAYLIYFGWRLLRRARAAATTTDSSDAATRIDRTEPMKAIVLGLVTALSNAQAILFITSIFAVSGVLTTNAATGVAVLAIIATLNVSYLGFLAALVRCSSALVVV
jgi:threonine efflux protein